MVESRHPDHSLVKIMRRTSSRKRLRCLGSSSAVGMRVSAVGLRVSAIGTRVSAVGTQVSAGGQHLLRQSKWVSTEPHQPTKPSKIAWSRSKVRRSCKAAHIRQNAHQPQERCRKFKNAATTRSPSSSAAGRQKAPFRVSG